MNFTNLRYFLEVAKDMSFTSAAKKLCVSQQSLS
ncbi:MAG TPA: LysR family transcriptional regulator, partial [Bacillota bacterium]|nr:LysR family transcriptional regulator [Bacillota bacterium]